MVTSDEVDDTGTDHAVDLVFAAFVGFERMGLERFGFGNDSRPEGGPLSTWCGPVGELGDEPAGLRVVQRERWWSVTSRGWGCEGVAVGSSEQEGSVGFELEVPVVAVDDPVVGGAQPGQVGEVGRAAVLPVVEVVGVDPCGGGVAVREPAAPVPGDHGVTQVR